MRSLRILAIQETDWISRNPIQQHQLFERMSIKGHEIHVIDYPIDWQLEKSKWRYLRTTRMKVNRTEIKGYVSLTRPPIVPLPIFSRLSSLLTHSYSIYKEIKSFKPDFIILFSITTGPIVHLLSRSFKIPVFFYVMDNLHQLQSFPRLVNIAKFFESLSIKNSYKVMIINKRLRKHVLDLGCPENKIFLLPMGVDADLLRRVNKREEIRKQIGVSPDELLLLFMGYLYPFSGLMEVIESLKTAQRSDLKLLILGGGGIEKELVKIVKTEKLASKVILHGQVPFSTIPGYLSAADICLLPMLFNETTKDITPIKVYEYLAASKPVIMTKLPGVYEEFSRIPGIIFVSKPEILLSYIPKEKSELKKWKENSIDGSKIIEERHNWPVVVSKFENLLYKFIEDSS